MNSVQDDGLCFKANGTFCLKVSLYSAKQSEHSLLPNLLYAILAKYACLKSLASMVMVCVRWLMEDDLTSSSRTYRFHTRWTEFWLRSSIQLALGLLFTEGVRASENLGRATSTNDLGLDWAKETSVLLLLGRCSPIIVGLPFRTTAYSKHSRVSLRCLLSWTDTGCNARMELL